MWLRNIATPARRRYYADSGRHVANCWPDNRAEDFTTVEAHNEHLLAWATVRFGRSRGWRPLKLPGARFLHRALDFIPRAQLESLFHGGLVDGESGLIKKPQWWRWPLAVLAGLYVPLASLGAAALSILIAATSLHPVSKVALVLTVVAGLLGHAMHAFLVLIQPLWIERKCRRRNIVERIMAHSW